MWAVGDPLAQGDHIGPVFGQIQYDCVEAMICKGMDEGARRVVGGLGRPNGQEQGWYVKPTLFADMRNDMAIAPQDIFGPVLVMIPFETEAIANDTPSGLDAFVATSDACRGYPYQRARARSWLSLWRVQAIRQWPRRRTPRAGRILRNEDSPPRSSPDPCRRGARPSVSVSITR
jgi:acyl-CoA reductase-like NAD-dependent aldehyde dehydrogenase